MSENTAKSEPLDISALEPLIAQTLQELNADFAQPGPDPYWPKWNNRWWKITLLYEMGLVARIPLGLLEQFAEEIDSHYLHVFPLQESELPAGCNPYSQILCPCALGTLLQVFTAAGLPLWQRWPWLASWLERYLLPDGGYNCDEAAYTGSGKSSVVSTSPMLEALCQLPVPESFEPTRRQLVRQSQQSLLRRRLLLSSKQQVIEPRWEQPLFPRFYEYDLLRGLKAVAEAALLLAEPLQVAELEPVLVRLPDPESETASAGLKAQSWYPATEMTLLPAPGDWQRQPVSSFALLDVVSQAPWADHFCQRHWLQSVRLLQHLNSQKLLLGPLQWGQKHT